jgi:hypothetical protein
VTHSWRQRFGRPASGHRQHNLGIRGAYTLEGFQEDRATLALPVEPDEQQALAIALLAG